MRKFSLLCLLALFPAVSTEASSISINNPTSPSTTVNFTTGGTYDWAHYGSDATSTSHSYDFSSTGPNSIGNVTAVKDGVDYYNYGSNTGPLQISWTNGEYDATETNNGNISYSSLGNTGDGLQFIANIAAGTSETLSVYACAADGADLGQPSNEGELSASLPDVSTVYNTTALPDAATTSHSLGDYVINVSNTTGGSEALTVQFTVMDTYGGGNLELYGVTASIVPEPASVALCVLGATLGLLARRRAIV